MTPRWNLGSVHARLTLWSAAVIGGVLLVYTLGVFIFLRASLYEELDRQLADEAELAEGSLTRLEGGRFALLGRTSSDPDHVGRWLEVWSVDGSLLYREGPESLDLPPPRLASYGNGGESSETVRGSSGSVLRVHTVTGFLEGTPVRIRVARPEAPLRHELQELLTGVAFGLPAAILLACLGGYFLAGRALAPVGEMAAQAQTITAERLSERLPIKNPDDELGHLGAVFNQTLARLQRSFDSLRRFTADAAHELRTPLTALRSVGEVALREPGSVVHPEVVGSMLEEVDRLAALVDTLLMLSRADAGRVEIDTLRVDVRQLAHDAADYLDVLAAERGQTISVDDRGPVHARADPRLVRQAVLNVLDNAIKHSPEGASIRIIVEKTDHEAVLEIVDQGPGIPPEHRERIFERFYRVDSARSRDTGGAGLGLSISQWAIEANGGAIDVEAAVPKGSRFRIRLPLDEGGQPPRH